MTSRSLFITGTDTNVGKTTITAALILALQQQSQSVGVFKPLETGVAVGHKEHSDTERLRHLLSPPPSFDSVCLYAFPQPLAPLAAARQTGTTIDLSRIRSHMHELDSTLFILAYRRSRRHFHPSYSPAHHTRLGQFIECSLFDRRKHTSRRGQPLPAHIRSLTASGHRAVRYHTQ